MATEVLRPQDVLVQRFRVHTTPCPRRRDLPANGASTSLASNQNQQRRPSTKHEKKRSTTDTRKPNQGGDLRRRSEIGGAVGKVTLLRRGESLNSLATKIGGSKPINTVVEDPAAIRARSDSEVLVPRKVGKAPPPKVDVYAGAAFESSPSPRCLPQPTFFSKKGEAFEDGATRSLRRMLRLE